MNIIEFPAIGIKLTLNRIAFSIPFINGGIHWYAVLIIAGIIIATFASNIHRIQQIVDICEKKGRKIAVLGDMLELGEHSPALHAQVGKKAAEQGVEQLICIGEQTKNSALSFGENSVCFNADEGEKAAEYIKNTFSAGDTVLFKGSRGMKLENIMKKVFDI